MRFVGQLNYQLLDANLDVVILPGGLRGCNKEALVAVVKPVR